jgi:hypothetical protein
MNPPDPQLPQEVVVLVPVVVVVLVVVDVDVAVGVGVPPQLGVPLDGVDPQTQPFGGYPFAFSCAVYASIQDADVACGPTGLFDKSQYP